MKTWCFVQDGRWTGHTVGGCAPPQPPDGCEAVEGEPRDLLAAGQMQPPAPPPTGPWHAAWTWDAARLQYVSTPGQGAIEHAAREERARRLAASDWIVARSAERGEPVPQAWRDYREALRDITQQQGWPAAVEWPEVPG